MKNKKVFLIILFFLVLLLLGTSKSNATSINDLKSKFPSGKYWNHIVGSGHNYWNGVEDSGSCNNPDGYTSSPCQYHNGTNAPWGQPDCNSFDAGQECVGFARKLFYDYYGVRSTDKIASWYVVTTDLKPGDVLTYNGKGTYGSTGHTVWIIGKTSDHYVIADCNWGNTCQIRWDANLYFSDIYSVKSASIAPREIYDGDSEKPVLSNIHVHTPSIEKDKINVRVHASDNVGVTAVKFSSWQSGNSATSGTTKWASYNTKDGCWETTFTKAEANISGDNLGCIQAWAYDAAGNESKYDGVYDFVFGQRIDLGSSFIARIVSKVDSNYCIGISGTNNDDDLKLKTKNQSDDSQLWSFIRNSDGTYRIINVKANKSFDTEGGTSAKENGTIMQLWSYVEAVSQMQYVIQSYNGGYRIVPANQAKVRGVDLKDGKAQENQPIIVYQACSKDNKAQTWTLEKVATSISMNVSSESIKIGSTKQLSVKFTPTDVKIKSVKWTTSDSKIATVSSSGVVTGVKEGTVTITATTTDGSNKKATCKVTITPFKDVDASYWGYSAIKYMYDRRYVSGTSTAIFSPEMKITRGMVVTILHNMEGKPYISGTSKFPDVQNSKEYYYNAVKWASANNIVSGYSSGKNKGKFGPDDLITREQLAVILWKYSQYKGKYKNVTADYSKFSDSKNISDFAKKGMNWAVGAGVITGSNGKLIPQGTATRAEAVSMIYKYCTKVK